MIYNEEYLNNLIKDRIEENIHLDYKAAGALDKTNLNKTKDSISKDIAAFANADGGILIYGLKEDKENKHLANEIDPIDRVNVSKEWLEQIIQSSIQPRIDNIQIYPIQIGTDKQKVVYVVNVPKSNTAHQSNDQKYYKRHNFNNLPMYDFEIRDVLNRIKYPLIEIEFIVQYTSTKTGRIYELVAKAHNAGDVMAQYVNCYLTLPSACLKSETIPQRNSNKQYYAENTIRDLIDVKAAFPSPQHIFGPSRYDPILPKRFFKLDFDMPALDEFYREDNHIVEWVVYADNAQPNKGRIKMSDIRQIPRY